MDKLAMILQIVIFAVVVNLETEGFVVDRRSATPERNADDYMDYQLGVKYDEYPMIVPKKRTAMLVDRLMLALKEAIDEEESHLENMIDAPSRSKAYTLSSEDVRTMNLQRRGHESGQPPKKFRPYRPCLFNAVTCF